MDTVHKLLDNRIFFCSSYARFFYTGYLINGRMKKMSLSMSGSINVTLQLVYFTEGFFSVTFYCPLDVFTVFLSDIIMKESSKFEMSTVEHFLRATDRPIIQFLLSWLSSVWCLFAKYWSLCQRGGFIGFSLASRAWTNQLRGNSGDGSPTKLISGFSLAFLAWTNQLRGKSGFLLA